eukprot:RCo021142
MYQFPQLCAGEWSLLCSSLLFGYAYCILLPIHPAPVRERPRSLPKYSKQSCMNPQLSLLCLLSSLLSFALQTLPSPTLPLCDALPPLSKMLFQDLKKEIASASCAQK